MGVKAVVVGNCGKQKIAGAERPGLLVEIDEATPCPAQLVHGPVVRPAAIDIPVEKGRAWVIGVDVAVEGIRYGELSRGDGDSRDVLLAGELVGAVVDRLLL